MSLDPSRDAYISIVVYFRVLFYDVGVIMRGTCILINSVCLVYKLFIPYNFDEHYYASDAFTVLLKTAKNLLELLTSRHIIYTLIQMQYMLLKTANCWNYSPVSTSFDTDSNAMSENFLSKHFTSDIYIHTHI